MTFLREHADERILVHTARADHRPVTLPLRALGVGSVSHLVPLLGEPGTSVDADNVQLPAGGPAAHVYRLPSVP